MSCIGQAVQRPAQNFTNAQDVGLPQAGASALECYLLSTAHLHVTLLRACGPSQVDMSDEEDQFQAVTTSCLNVLILAVETRLDIALQQMTRMPWATLETVISSIAH